jgi:hypothetical protein
MFYVHLFHHMSITKCTSVLTLSLLRSNYHVNFSFNPFTGKIWRPYCDQQIPYCDFRVSNLRFLCTNLIQTWRADRVIYWECNEVSFISLAAFFCPLKKCIRLHQHIFARAPWSCDAGIS